MNIIFLDFDGVLNDNNFFASNHNAVKKLYKENVYNLDDIDFLLKRQMLDIDFDKLQLLKRVIDETNAKVVVISSWKKMKIFPYVVDKLIELGIPVVGYTIDNGSDRGKGIKQYLMEHRVDNYVILDDDIFDDYDNDLLNKLVKTNFYNGGLNKKHTNELIKKLK